MITKNSLAVEFCCLVDGCTMIQVHLLSSLTQLIPQLLSCNKHVQVLSSVEHSCQQLNLCRKNKMNHRWTWSSYPCGDPDAAQRQVYIANWPNWEANKKHPTLKKGTKKVAYGSLADIVRGLPHTVLLHIIGLAICTAQVNLIDWEQLSIRTEVFGCTEMPEVPAMHRLAKQLAIYPRS